MKRLAHARAAVSLPACLAACLPASLPACLAACLAVLPTASAQAQHQTFTVQPAASQAKMTLHTTHEVVEGTFPLQCGAIDFDRGAHRMSGSVVVLASGGKTGNGSRDKKMYKDVLLVGKFQTVTFAPKSYTGTLAATGHSSLQVTGLFTLLGTPHEITIPMDVHMDGTSADAKAHFIVPYVQWGLKNPSFLVWKADDDVAIDLSLVGTLAN